MDRTSMVVIAALVCMPVIAMGQPLTPPPGFTGDPLTYGVRPTATPAPDDFTTFYPAKAQGAHVAGAGVVSCMILQDGAAQDCKLVSEDPAGWSFGDAAVKLAKLFRWPTENPGGKSIVGHRIRFRISFGPAS